jgi:hypothetical protein
MKPENSVRFPELLLVFAAGVLAACSGDAPTRPTPAIPVEPDLLPAGRYTVSVATSFDPSSCTGRLDAWELFGPIVSTYIDLASDGNAWSAHAQSAADGDVSLRLRRDGDNGGEVLVSGEIQGTLLHLFDRFTPRQSRRRSPPRRDWKDACSVCRPHRETSSEPLKAG